jgi:hypothetical protein
MKTLKNSGIIINLIFCGKKQLYINDSKNLNFKGTIIFVIPLTSEVILLDILKTYISQNWSWNYAPSLYISGKCAVSLVVRCQTTKAGGILTIVAVLKYSSAVWGIEVSSKQRAL